MSIRSSILPFALLSGAVMAGCGGSGPSPVAPTAVATPAPVPVPTSTPMPSPTATPAVVCADCEITDNHNPVDTASIRLYMLFNEEHEPIEPLTPDPDGSIPIRVGHQMRLDLTGKDAQRRQTYGTHTSIDWFFSDDSIIDMRPKVDYFQYDVWPREPGTLTVYAIFDGVRTNDLVFRFVK
jgi:hypothetical protein